MKTIMNCIGEMIYIMGKWTCYISLVVWCVYKWDNWWPAPVIPEQFSNQVILSHGECLVHGVQTKDIVAWCIDHNAREIVNTTNW